jgi:replicative DNA helicase
MELPLIQQGVAVEDSWNRFQENRQREWGLSGVDTGIHPLNLLIGGWLPRKVTVVGARSGIGKTAMVTPVVSAGSRVINGRRAAFLFCTWEMSASYLVDRHICHSVGITNRFLHQGAKLLGQGKLDAIKSAYKEATKLPVTYQEMSTDINQLSAAIRTFCEEQKEISKIEGVEIQPVVIIDYIQMAQFEGAGLRTYGIGDFMNKSKSLANETGCSFLIFAQIKRSADDKDMPERNDFADSQSIEMASDNLILLHRPEYNGINIIKDPRTGDDTDSRMKMLIRVLKGRDFGTGDVLINCDIKYYRFWDIDHDSWDYQYWNLYDNKDFWMDHFFKGDEKTEVDKLSQALEF